MKKIFRNKNGFSVVEILAVIVILGILIAISAPAVLKYIDSSTQNGYDSIARSARDGAESYLMDTPSFSGEIQIKDLVEDGLLEKPIDPDDGSYICDGSVAYELVTGDEGGLDEYKYTVNLCCSEYESAYEFPGGATKKIQQADFCRIIRSTGRLPGREEEDPEPETNPNAPTCSLRAELDSGKLVNGAYTSDVNGNLELTIKMDVTGDAVQKGLSTDQKSTNGKVSTKHNAGDGEFTYYGYVGRSGQYNSCELDIIVDTTPPSCPTITAYSNGSVLQPEVWTSNPIEFRFDFDSDAYKYEWFVNDSSDQLVKKSDNEITDDDSKKKTVSAAGQRRIALNVYDKYDNKRECLNDNKYYFIDSSVPTCTLNYVSTTGLNGWYNSSGEIVMLIENAGDSGVQTGIVEGNSDTINSIDKLLITSDVNTTYRGNILTGTGAKGSCDLQLKVDMTPPAVENLRTEIDGTGRKIKATFKDNTSKLVEYAISATDSATMPADSLVIDNKDTFDFSHKINFRAATYYIWVRDGAGHVTKTSINVEDQYFNISYDLDDGTVDMTTLPTTYIGGESFETAVPTRAGWDFKGWKVSGIGSSSDNTKINVGYQDMTVTAMWETIFIDYISFLNTTAASANSLRAHSDFYEIDGEVVEQLREIRYVGGSPNNFVMIDGELWRILGSFNNINVKLVKNDYLSSSAWDTSNSSINSGAGVNEWSQADIMTAINNHYSGKPLMGYAHEFIWNTGYLYNGKYTVSDYVKPAPEIDEETGEEIEVEITCEGEICYYDEVNHKLYAISPNAGYDVDYAYNVEKSFDIEENLCLNSSSPHCSDTVTRTSSWVGNIGLITASDYAYASTNTDCHDNIRDTSSNKCSVNNWLHTGTNYWTITPAAYYNSKSLVMYVSGNGYIAADVATKKYGVRPVVNLRADTIIVTGNGTQSDPYILK